MNSNFNRQFIMIDFELLDDRRFIEFINAAEFGTYLLMRRYIWRGNLEHPLNLDGYYRKDRLLVSAIRRETLAEKLKLKDATRISKHLTRLQKLGVVRRIRTGRESIYVLGEWVDISEKKDGSEKIEWFYLERKYGLNHSDVAQNATSDVAKNAHQRSPQKSHQTWRKTPHPIVDINTEENKEKTVLNVRNGEQSIFKDLPDLDQPLPQTDSTAQDMAKQLGDPKSARFYYLIAQKIPAMIIYPAIAEAKQEGKNPAALFTYKMKEYAARQIAEQNKKTFAQKKKELLAGK